MSNFSDEFQVIAGEDLVSVFGETLSWVNLSNQTISGVGMVLEMPTMTDKASETVDYTQSLTVDMLPDAVAGGLPQKGWRVEYGGNTYTVMQANTTGGGLWRVTIKLREMQVSRRMGR